MLLSDWRVLARRWYVVLVGLPLTFGLCYLITTVVPVQYEANSKTLMLPPQSTFNGLPTNPYLNLGGLDGMTDVLASAMGDASVQKKMVDAGHATAKYEFTRDQTAAGPVVLLNVTDNSAEGALASQKFLLAQMAPVLEGLQRQVNVPSKTFITQMVFTQDVTPTISRKQQLRLLLVTGVGGIGFTYLAAAMLDGILRSRRKPPAGASQALTPPIEPRKTDIPSLSGIGISPVSANPVVSRPAGAGDSFPRPQPSRQQAPVGPPQGQYPRQDARQEAQYGQRGQGVPNGGGGPAGFPGRSPEHEGSFSAFDANGRGSNGYGQDYGDANGHAPDGRDSANSRAGRKRNGRGSNGENGQGGLNWLQ